MLLEHFVDTEKRPPIRLYDERQTRSQSISQLNNIQTGTRTDRQTDRQTREQTEKKTQAKIMIGAYVLSPTRTRIQ